MTTSRHKRPTPRFNYRETIDALAAFRDLTASAIVVNVSRDHTLVLYDHARFDRLLELLEDDADSEDSVTGYDLAIGPHGLTVSASDREGCAVLDEPHDDEGEAEPSLGSPDRANDQTRWADSVPTGWAIIDGELDVEDDQDDDSDIEPSLGSLNDRLAQTGWAISDASDRELAAGPLLIRGILS